MPLVPPDDDRFYFPRPVVPPAGIGADCWPPRVGDVIVVGYAGIPPIRYLVLIVEPTPNGMTLELLPDPEDV